MTARLPRLPPVVAVLMRNPMVVWILFAVVSVHLLLARWSVTLWDCAFRETTGLSCPGCGLTRASLMLFRGQWREAAQIHPFSPFFGLFGLFLVLSALLPQVPRRRLAEAVERVERRTGATWIVLVAFLGYAIIRLVAELV
jgi:hypothetical protein